MTDNLTTQARAVASELRNAGVGWFGVPRLTPETVQLAANVLDHLALEFHRLREEAGQQRKRIETLEKEHRAMARRVSESHAHASRHANTAMRLRQSLMEIEAALNSRCIDCGGEVDDDGFCKAECPPF